MAKLTITRGLPASGKSTWAEEVRSADPDAVRVVTMDDIRVAIGSRFDQGDESIVQSIRDFTIRRYLEKGYHVISADTNLPEKVVRNLRKLAVQSETWDKGIPVEIKDFRDVSLEICLERNLERWYSGDRKVPDEAIISMHDRFVKGHSRTE
jgi:predicted kinase